VLTIYVIENLGKDVPPESRYYTTFMNYQKDLRREWVRLFWDPIKPRGPLARNPTKVPNPQVHPLTLKQYHQVDLVMRQRENLLQMKEAEYKKFLQQQFDTFRKEQVKQTELLQGMMRDLAREELPEIAQKCRDPQPLVRWLAIQVVAKHWLPLEGELIELLADPDPHVKLAACQGLSG
jgi:hypothetical protein